MAGKKVKMGRKAFGPKRKKYLDLHHDRKKKALPRR